MKRKYIDEIRKDFRIEYQVLLKDIEFIKTLQWKTTYFIILLLAGLAGLYQLYYSIQKPLCDTQRWKLINLCGFVIVIMGNGFLAFYIREMKRKRKRLTEVFRNFSNRFQKYQYEKGNMVWRTIRDYSISIVMALTMWGAWYLLTWLP